MIWLYNGVLYILTRKDVLTVVVSIACNIEVFALFEPFTIIDICLICCWWTGLDSVPVLLNEHLAT